MSQVNAGIKAGDLIDTPNIDRMAQEGMLFSSQNKDDVGLVARAFYCCDVGC